MNIAVVFAGGTGQRMNSKSKPKQFLMLHGRPIIIYTLERFEQHPDVDAIVVVCLSDWIDELKRYINKYGLTKIASIVPGGDSGQASIRNGVYEAARLFPSDSVVLVHDGVRPLVDSRTISDCIDCVEERGSAVTVVPAIETIVQSTGGVIDNIIDRKSCQLARAPQCFRLGELREAHERALDEGLTEFIDSASLMAHYGHTLYEVEGSSANIKITTPSDYYIMRAIMDEQEDSQFFGF